jgi:hypothetical protein
MCIQLVNYPKSYGKYHFFHMDLNLLACVWLTVEWLAQNILVNIYFNGILGIRIIPHVYPCG